MAPTSDFQRKSAPLPPDALAPSEQSGVEPLPLWRLSWKESASFAASSEAFGSITAPPCGARKVEPLHRQLR